MRCWDAAVLSSFCTAGSAHGGIGSPPCRSPRLPFAPMRLDLWGFGDTAHNVLNYSLEQQASLIDRFLMEMGIGKIALVGHGLGGTGGHDLCQPFPSKRGSFDGRQLSVGLCGCPCPSADCFAGRTDSNGFPAVPRRRPPPWLIPPKPIRQAIAASMVGLQANNVFSSFRGIKYSLPAGLWR